MSSKVQIERDDKVLSRRQSSKQAVRDAAVMSEHTTPATIIQRARVEPGSLTPHDVLQLQRTIGNQAVQGLLDTTATYQTKPTFNTPGDSYEQEADRVADRVMRMPEATIQRDTEFREERAEEEVIQTKPTANQGTLPAQSTESDEVPPIVQEVVNSTGQPLDPATSALMERRFDHDFGQVRVHTDGKAAESAHALNALAYTLGQDVVFGAGQYAPGTTEGDRLLAHELTHVVQQTGMIQRQPASEQQQQPASEEQLVPSFVVFVAEERKRRDNKYARRLGQADAAEIRKKGKLEEEYRMELNAKLRFFEGEAREIYGQEIKPALAQVIEGGIADVTNLEQDMRDILQEWRDAAVDGINLFVTTELSKRIDDLESGSWKTFITAMIGNTMWAAAVFFPPAAAASAFAVSMAGVVVAAAPTIPSQSESAVPQVQKLMGDYIYSIYDQLNAGLRNNAFLLIKEHPGITRYRALGEFVENSFLPGFYKRDQRDETIPALNKSAIRDKYKQVGEDTLDVYTSFIGRVPPHEYLINEIAWIKDGGEKKLAMIQLDYFVAHFPPTFLKWIPKEVETIAIERWKSFPGSQGKIRTFESSEINF